MQNTEDDSLLKAFFKNKWVRAILVINFLIIITLIAIFVINARKVSTITFDVAPIDAHISINGTTYTNGTYSITPGKYQVEISHSDLDSKTLPLDIEPHHDVIVAAFLSQNGNFDFYEQKDNFKSFQKLQEIASSDDNKTTDHDSSAETFIKDFKAKYQFLSNLPIIDRTPSPYGTEYGVNYQYDTFMIQDGKNLEECQKIFCLHVTDTSGQRQGYAATLIQKFGLNPEDFQIVYEKVEYEEE